MPTDRPISWRKRCERALIVRLVPVLVRFCIRLLGVTWRIRVSGLKHLRWAQAQDVPVVAGALHARLLLMIHPLSRPGLRGWLVLISASRDGDLITRAVRPMGLEVVSGSTGRDGARGFLGIVRALRAQADRIAGFLVDGGHGPRGHCKAGIIQVAQRTGGWVLPVLVSAAPAWIARRTWDRTVLAKPQATVHVAFGSPMPTPRGDALVVERQRRRLEEYLIRGTAMLDRHIGLRDPEPLRVPLLELESGAESDDG